VGISDQTSKDTSYPLSLKFTNIEKIFPLQNTIQLLEKQMKTVIRNN